ncbi:MAG: gamma-glutamylcyclotransferase [Paracoccaceae bacterium]|nr:gamma-glutamylcyclotransferase [Paracoccaceae bacterium]
MQTPSFPPALAFTHVFGYGSLVNLRTHAHADARPVQVTGWRREWRATTLRQLAFLSVTPDPGCSIAGLTARVAEADWPALDRREAAYDRVSLPPESLTPGVDGRVAIYAIPPGGGPALEDHPILLSYLDVVVQGFLDHFGPDGAAAFFDTTTGWQAPVLDDRAAPLYPRAQPLLPETGVLVDAALARRKVRRIAAG